MLFLLVACAIDAGFSARVEPADVGCVPSAEICNGRDDDCDHLVDDADPDRIDAPAWHADVDGDGHGDPGTSDLACIGPTGWTDDATDCDDADAAKSPTAPEVCNGLDDDCDGLVDGKDEGLVDGLTSYRDADDDGHGDADAIQESCNVPPGYVELPDDCDDDDAAISPDAIELCNGIDDDCNGEVDDGDTSDSTWYYDADGDGWGDGTVTSHTCEPADGWVENGRDCDDTDASSGLCPGEIDDGSICSALWGIDDGQVPTWTGACDSADGFEVYDGRCYYAVEWGASWNDARASCVAAGGHLATMLDASEAAFVFSLAGRVFTGACDADREGTWTWITGEAWSYADFAVGEPNDCPPMEECLEITRDAAGWNDIDCSQNRSAQGYVCEFE